jgi:hypothetical protein
MRNASRVPDFGVTAIDVVLLIVVLVGAIVLRDALASLRRLWHRGAAWRSATALDRMNRMSKMLF